MATQAKSEASATVEAFMMGVGRDACAVVFFLLVDKSIVKNVMVEATGDRLINSVE